MKKTIDIGMAILLIMLFSIPMIVISLLIKMTSRGPVLYWSDRVGKNNLLFKMPKFRTMSSETPAVATHLLEEPDIYITPIGKFLRRTSMDEIPQLFSIIKGDMGFIGPRPALFNQSDLIELRTKRNIHTLTPGITGWAQINGRDEVPIPVKVDLDEYYLKHRSWSFDAKILFQTLIKVIKREGVQH